MGIEIRLLLSESVETICLLSRETYRPTKDYIKVGIDAEDYYAIKNSEMHISGIFEEKVDIESVKVDIESAKVDIRNKLLSYSITLSEKTINHTIELYIACKEIGYFGRSVVEAVTGLKKSLKVNLSNG